MINKKIIIISLLFVILMSVQCVSAIDDADINIMEDNEDNGLLQAPSETQTYTDLKNVIDSDTTGEITLDYNYQFNEQNNDPRTGINITKNLVINGNGATIDGASASSLFNISSGVTVTLKNLTIKNSAAIENPEVFYRAITSNGNLNIYDCTFDSNAAGQGWENNDDIFYVGSVIYSSGNINIMNSNFINNMALNGGIIYTTGTIRANNSYFYSNKAIHNEYSLGGVITALVVDIIENCTFKNNFANAGGSIFIYGGSTTSIKNSTFEGSTTYPHNGGAIFNYGSADLLIENSTFKDFTSATGGAIYIDNSDSNIKIKNSVLKHLVSSSSYGGGGAIYTEGNVEIENTTVEDNSAITGGVVYAKGSVTFKDCNKISSNGVITSTSNGGVAYAEGNVIIDNSSLTNNKAHDLGGAIYALGSVTVNNSNVSQNSVSHYVGKRMAGAIYAKGNVIIENSTVSKNSAYYNAGAIYTLGGVIVKNSTISDNIAFDWSSSNPIRGGAIYANGSVLIENTSFIHNVAKDEGGSVYTNSTITIKNSNNIANNGKDQNTLISKGGVFYAKGDVVINNTEFSYNYANVAGGAIYSEGNVNFYNSKVNGSEASVNNGDGGFIYAEGNVNVENATISDVYMRVSTQVGKYYSGAVYAEGDMIIRNATFDHINKEHHSYGGAICVLGNVEIYNSNFTNNQAVLYAAGYVNGTLDIYDCIFTNNSDGAIFSEGNAVVNSTKFINNTISGSAMYGIAIGSNGTLNLTNSYVYGSNAHDSNYRGSVFSKNNLYVENCTFDEIHSEAGTATGMIISTKSNASIINTEFLDFSYHGSTIYGGSIYAGVNAYVENCTFFNATLVNQNGQTHGLCIYSEENITLYNSNLIDIDSSNGQNGAVKGSNYVYVFNSTFINITGARSSGGAIYANVANVTNSSFYRILCSDNVDKGGAIYANDTYIYYNNFTNCHAGVGGAIYSLNYTTAIQNIFINNSNQYSGGAIYTKNGFIQYNVILENMGHTWNLPADIAIVDSIVDSLEYNWWGENVPFGTEDKQKRVQVNVQSSQGTYFLPDTWVLMDFYVNPNQDFVGQGLNLTTTLDHYLNNTEPEGSNIHDLDHNIAKRTVVYKAINKTAEEQAGWFSHDTAPIINQDYVLYSNNNFLKHNVSATIDYQTLYLTVAQFHVNVTKNVTDLTPEVDDEITYTILVNNTDTTDYSDPSAVIEHPTKINITITDILDPRLKFISANDTNYNPITGEWFIENIDINGTIALTIKVKVLKGGNITNYANVTKINDNVLTNPYGANVTIQVPLVYKLDVNKTVDKKEVVLGDKVTFTINVTNIGSGNLTNVTVIDKLPSGFEFNSSDDARYNNKTGKLIITQLEEGQSVVFHIVALTTTEGLLTNNVNATCDENKTEFKSSVSVDVKPFVNLTVSKSVNVTSVLVGDKLKYTITVKNVGLSTATLVNVTDVVDSSLVEVIKGESSGGYDTVVANGWRIASLAPGAEATLTLVVKINAAGTIVNSVAVNSSENKTPVTNKSDDVDADPFVNLTVSKSVNVTAQDVVLVGDKLKYTITVKNVGLSTATGVNVTDVVDSSLVEVIKGESSGGYDTVVANGWRIASLAPGAEATLTLVVKINAAGTIVNSVAVNSSENKTPVTNKSVDVDADPFVNLTVSKSVNVTAQDVVLVGDKLKYTITVKNVGLSTATGVNVTDVVDSSLVEVIKGESSGGYDTVVANGWRIASLAPGAEATLTLVVKINAAGTIVNSVAVNCSENKTPVTNKSVDVDADPNSGLSITKKANVTSVIVGDLVEYTITVKNNGLSDATGVKVWDILPVSVTYKGGADAYDVITRNATWTIDSIAASQSFTVTLIVNVTSVGNVTNTAFANCNENKTVVNKTSENVTANPNVKFTVSKSVNVTSVVVGDKLKYTIVVKNVGLSAASLVNVSDVVDSSLVEVIKGESSDGYDTVVANGWRVDSLAPGQSETLILVVRVVGNGTIVNAVGVNSSENKTPVTNKSDDVDADPFVNLTVSKSVNVTAQDVVLVGDKLKYTITVKNVGLSTATGVNVTDVVDSSLVEVIKGESSGGYDTVVANGWRIASLAPGAEATLTLVVKINAEGTIVNSVAVNSSENKTPVTNKSDDVDADPNSGLSITKKANVTSVIVGDLVEYTITVKNNGLSDVTDVKVWDILPVSVTYKGGADAYDVITRNATWTIDSIAASQSFTVTLIVNVTSVGNVTNTAFANCNENKTVVNKTSENVTANPNVKFTVSKSVNVTSVVVGDKLKYTIVVKNVGLSAASLVNVTDVVDSSLVEVVTAESSQGYGSVVANGWRIASLAPGQSETLILVVRVVGNGTIVNSVAVNSSENKTPVTNKSDDVDADPNSGLSIAKKANVTSVIVGDLVEYTITVKNNGLSDATGVKVWDILPASVTYKSGADAYDVNTRNATWTIDSIASGKSAVVTLVVNVTSAGNVTNTAFANCNENKTVVNRTSENVTVGPNVKLTMDKVANVSSVVVGDLVEYTITVRNDGLSDATGVKVWDILPSGVKYVEGGSYDVDSRNVTWTIDSIASGKSAVVTLVVNVTSAGDVINTVFANCNENKTVVNRTSENVTADPNVKFTVSKTVNVTAQDVVLVGDKLKYTITVKNVGLSAASLVNVTDVVDSSLVDVVVDESSQGYGSVVANGWRVDSLAPGSEATFYLVVKINAAGTIVNSVAVNSSENKTPVTNKSDDVDAGPNSGLSIAKKANVTSVVVGDLVEYTITVRNVGLSDATGVKVWDILPAGVKYVEGGSYDADSRNVTWTIDSIAAGKSAEVYVIVNVTSMGNVTNTAFANCNENKTVVNKTSDNVTVGPNVKLTMDKVANVTEVVVGDLIKYTITVRNDGLSDASGVNVWDILPAGVKYVEGGSYDADSRNVTWTIDSIAAGKSAEVYVIVNVTSAGDVTNTVFANCDENKTVVNKTSDNVTADPNVNLKVSKSVNVTEAYVGDDIKFTITVTNNGLSDATIVKIEDMLPDSVKFVSANGTYTNVGQKVVWTIDKIPMNSSVDVYVIVKAVASGSLVNSAYVTCADNSTSKTNSSEVNVKPVVNLDVVKSANVSDILIGDKVGFNITVTNKGPSNASNVIVVDMLPDGLKFISSSLDCVVDGNEVTWNVSKLNDGEIIIIEVICEAVGAGDLTNTVNVTCDENKTSTTGGTPIHVSELVDVAIILSVNNTKPDINGEIIITLVLRNYGPSTATDITGKLNKDFLRGLEIISIDSKDIIFHSDDLLSYALSDILRFNEDGTFELAYLEANNEASATIKARVISDGNLTIDGIVSSHEKDSNLSNNYGELTLNVHSLVDLSVDVTANDTTPTVGDEIEYTIVVVNKGPSNATDIIVKDKLPDGVTYISDSSGGAYNPVTGVWTIDDMKPGENRTLTINVKVDVPGEITNFVDVNSSQDNLNPEGSKNNVTINVKDFDKVDLRLTKTANATKAYVGDLVVYTITVSNKGSVNATGVLVYEDLLDGLRYISDDSNGRYDPTSGIWNISNLNAGENMVLNILVQLTKAGNIINYAIVVADQKILNITESFDNVTIEVVEHAKNETDNETFILQKGDIRLKEVGNSLMILMLALLSVGTFLRRKKQ